MFGLQELFDETIKKQFEPNILMARILEIKLEDIGIRITDSQRVDFEKQFVKFDNSILCFDFTDEQVKDAGVSSEEELKPILKKIADDLVGSIEKFVSNIEETMDDIVESMVNQTALSVKNTLRTTQNDMVEDYGAIYHRFTQNLDDVWGNALNLLQGLIVIVDEATQGYLKSNVDNNKSDITRDVLIRLQARSSQIAKEILTLIRNGFADGAHARWRSLHEIAVVTSFIKEYGNDVALMYVEHESIESYKAALQYNEFYTRLGAEPILKHEIDKLKNDYDELINKYGKNYRHEYGWASEAINVAKPSFRDIEKSIQLDHLRPYYKLASHNVHANVKGILFKLGLYPEEDIMLAGPSSVGLSEPAKLTAISLSQISSTLFTHNPTIDFLVISRIILEYSSDVENEFISIEQKLVSDFN